MSFYSQVVFPRLCDFLLDRPPIAQHRRELLARVSGRVLEIGFGTGLNLPHYPAGVDEITTIDPSQGMHRWAKKRIARSGINVEQRLLSSEQLPFDDHTFDCVVSTFTLCSIHDVHRALTEVFRVLTAGGRFLFLEHGLSPKPSVQEWQRRLNWLEMKLADGCRLDRDMRELVTGEPFSSVDLVEMDLPRFPQTHGHLYRGMAVK